MTDTNSMKRRYLALRFPFLAADRLRNAEPERFALTGPATPPEPLALVGKVKGALRLGAVDAAALALGLTPGMMLADARAMVPGLQVAECDPAADRHWLERLARACRQWSPRVSIAGPDGIVLDIAGVDHLFGGEAALMARIEQDLAASGMSLRLACAATAEAALALARHAPLPVIDEAQALRALPVAALELDAEATLALQRADLRTIGDLVSRPLAGLAARFGAGAATALRRLTGDEQAPVEVLQLPGPLRFERRFAEPVALEASIAACFLDLLREAAGVLQERGLGGRRFVLTLLRSDGARHRLAIETGLPTRDPAPVLRLFDERIARLADPLDPGFGYDRIVLTVPLAEPLGSSQPGLGGEERAEDDLAELLDRLSTRLGAANLYRLAPRDSHIPEQAQLALPAISGRLPAPWPAPPPGEPPLRPLFLFDPPQPVEVIAEVPDGPPHRFRWKRQLHEVRLYEGPERIATEWWRRRGGENGAGEGPGKGGLTRDYYRIEDARGRRYWIFRHGLYHEKPVPRWYLHGLFA